MKMYNNSKKKKKIFVIFALPLLVIFCVSYCNNLQSKFVIDKPSFSYIIESTVGWLVFTFHLIGPQIDTKNTTPADLSNNYF